MAVAGRFAPPWVLILRLKRIGLPIRAKTSFQTLGIRTHDILFLMRNEIVDFSLAAFDILGF